jgi:acetyl-CoA carboxylase carboxyl transferase subunit alpha
MKTLPFEQPLKELQDKIEELERLSEEGSVDLTKELDRIRTRATGLKKEIYSNLSPSQIIQISRHPNRPDSTSLIRMISEEFMELHGDRLFGDDPSIVGGFAKIDSHRVIFIGHQKGHDTKENIYRNFGMPHPEGYRKALRLMRMAEKFNLPIVTFIDTPGAYPGKEAEERGQAEAIATNLKVMAGLKVPIISFVIGEGGSGGALGIGVSNRVYMLQNSVYSVISPEGCASILYRDAAKAPIASESLKITAPDIVKLGVADDIVKEPLGGAHYDWKATADNIKKVILKDLAELKKLSITKLLDDRYKKFRSMGVFAQS